MFVAISRFTLAKGMNEAVDAAFRNRPHLVDQAPGFVRMSVMKPVDRVHEYWLVTYWQQESDFRAWHRSEAYHASHSGIPGGLKLLPGSTEISYFEVITE